ncbi:MAG: hypothetical protein GX182_00415 [Firmicutes bacterium]|nr:hypothetical protein [Bacillota bacterium]
MREYVTRLEDYDLVGFVDALISFARTIVSEELEPTSTIVEVFRDKKVRWDPEEGPRDVKTELLDQQKTLFFPFTNVGVDDLVRCADGDEYWKSYLDEDQLDEELSEAGLEALECHLGETEMLGYLAKVQDGKLIIKPALFYSGMCVPPFPPSVE